jgi:periplasmic protein CpxP/Spy
MISNPARTARPNTLGLWSAGVVLALASAFSMNASAREGGPPPPMMMGGMMSGHMLDHMLDGMNATDQQRSQIDKIAKAARDDLKAQRDSAGAAHEQALQLFAQPSVDAAGAESLRQQMIGQQDQASRRMLQAMLDISQVLTPEQRAQFAQRMKERAERHGRDGSRSPESRR